MKPLLSTILITLSCLRIFAQTGDSVTYVGTLAQARVNADYHQSAITTDYGGGTWYYDATDHTSADDTATIFVTTGNQRFKRIFEGSVNVKWFGAKGDGVTDDRKYLQMAINYLYNMGGGTLEIPKGIYMVSSDIRFNASGSYRDGRFTIKGGNGSIIKKSASFPSDGYIFQFRRTNEVTVEGLSFAGKTPTLETIAFGDNGIGFFSSDECRVLNCTFKNFGDGCIKVSSTMTGGIPTKVESKRVIVTNNIFYNCIQTSTTPGGAAEYIFSNNTLSHSRTKFATRYPGATSLIFSGNTLDSMDNDIAPLEISGYKNYIINGNVIKNFKKFAINIYTNSEAEDSLVAKNAVISQNIISNGGGGIRVGNNTLPNGYKNTFSNLSIEGNTLDSIYTNPAISLIDGYFSGVSIKNNSIKNYSNYSIWIAPFSDSAAKEEDIDISGNIITADTYAIRIASREAQSNRPVTNVSISGNILYGQLSLERIQKCNVTNNTFDLKKNILFYIYKATNIDFKTNRFYLANANGPNFSLSGSIIFSGNNISGTSPNYALRYDPGCFSPIREMYNVITGTITRLSPVIIETTDIIPEGIVNLYNKPSNLSGTPTGTLLAINNSDGTGITIPAATAGTAGLLTASKSIIIDSLAQNYVKLGGNTIGGTLSIGTNDFQTINFKTNGLGRFSISAAGISTISNFTASGIVRLNTYTGYIKANGSSAVTAATTIPYTDISQPAGGWELLANKSSDSLLGNSNVLFPTQNAVRAYIDHAITTNIHSGASSFEGDGSTTDFTVTLPEALPDSNYQIAITPTSPLSSWYIHSKTTTSFTVKFAVAPPATGTQNIQFDWLIHNNN